MIYTKQDMVSAFEKGWYAAEDYDELSSALEDFVGRMEADEADMKFDKESEAMEDWRLRKDSK